MHYFLYKAQHAAMNVSPEERTTHLIHTMELHIWLAAIAFFLLVVRPLLNRSRVKNRPPGPTGLPFIGNLFQVGPKPHEAFCSLAKTYGPIMSLRMGSVNVVVASSPNIAQEIFQKNGHNFTDRPVPDSIACQKNMEGSLAWAPIDQLWRNRRRLCGTKMFSGRRLDLLQHARHRVVQKCIQRIREHCAAGTPVNIGLLASDTTLNFMTNTIFSVDVDDLNFESTGKFKDLIVMNLEAGGKPNISDFVPALKRFDLQGSRRKFQLSIDRLGHVFDELISKRSKSRAASTDRNGDFLDVMLDLCEEESSCFNLDNLKPLLVDLFVAGSDTSWISVEWAVAELLRNPETLQKARKEVLEVIGEGGEVKESDVEKLPYIQATVKEALRLHPPTPLLLPYLASNDVAIGGYTVQKGDQVLVNAWSIARDSKYWDKPLLFSPERFLGSAIDYKGRNFEYIPFGAGRRVCPGLPLANRMLYFMLASMLYSFDWKLPDGVSPCDMDMREDFRITLRKAVPLWALPVA
uniref:Cytochrome P450 oxidase CYP76Y19 n=1 Tax=Polygala tenuifolia TaxID=355332 RepID=A0A3G5ANH1_9FABA|nr:cytochrome P450 oxidase CYP76Y19 [Polygala tenuifolia]